jgi:hypothetical protein
MICLIFFMLEPFRFEGVRTLQREKEIEPFKLKNSAYYNVTF